MERLKRFLHKLCFRKSSQLLPSDNEIITFEDESGHMKCIVIFDIFFCILLCVIWGIFFTFFNDVVLAVNRKPNASLWEYFLLTTFFISCFFAIIIYIRFAAHVMAQHVIPKIAVHVDKKTECRNKILRIRSNSEDLYIETEVKEADLSYSHVLKVCCKELDLDASSVECIIKMPNVRIRNDEDVKRFKSVEYLQLVGPNK